MHKKEFVLRHFHNPHWLLPVCLHEKQCTPHIHKVLAIANDNDNMLYYPWAIFIRLCMMMSGLNRKNNMCKLWWCMVDYGAATKGHNL